MADLQLKPVKVRPGASRKAGWIVWLLLALPIAYFTYDRFAAFADGGVTEARVLDCKGSWVRRTSSGTSASARLQLQHKPVAYTEAGHKAVGSIPLSDEWCEQMLGSAVQVALDPEGKAHRFISFVQFWALPSFGWYVLGAFFLSLLGARPAMLVVFNLGYLGSAVFMAYVELYPATMPARADAPSDHSLALCIEREMHDSSVSDPGALRQLRCQSWLVDDLTPLASLTALEKLYLQGASLETLETMPALPSLRVLSVAGNKRLHSLAGIKQLPALQELQANGAGVEDLAGMAELRGLRIVAFMRNRLDDGDMPAFAQLESLEDVLLNYNQISDLSALSNKPRLRELQVYGNRVSDISPLFGNQALTLVGVRGAGKVPCSQIYALRDRLEPDARVYGQAACDER